MDKKSIIVGLDVGTTKVCTVVGEQDPFSQLEIIGIGICPNSGFRKGALVNINKVVKSIHSSLEEAQLMTGVNITHALVGVTGNHIHSFNSSGVVAVKGKEIMPEDLERVLEVAKAVVLPSGHKIIQVIPQEFCVDGAVGIKNPIGMQGIRLEVSVHLVTAPVVMIKNLIKCVEQSGVKVEDTILQPQASSTAVLSSEEKEMGVVLVDIGGGTTDVAIWKNSHLIHSRIIPVGGDHFTNDLAIALKTSYLEAERIKVRYGCVLSEKLNQSAHITIQGLTGEKDIQLNVISNILGARAEELLDIIGNLIKEKNLQNEVRGGCVLTGGGSLIKALPELGEYVLERPVKIGCPISFGGMTNIMKDPKFSTALGLLSEAAKRRKTHESTQQNDLIGRLSESVKVVFKEIF